MHQDWLWNMTKNASDICWRCPKIRHYKDVFPRKVNFYHPVAEFSHRFQSILWARKQHYRVRKPAEQAGYISGTNSTNLLQQSTGTASYHTINLEEGNNRELRLGQERRKEFVKSSIKVKETVRWLQSTGEVLVPYRSECVFIGQTNRLWQMYTILQDYCCYKRKL